MKIGSTWRTTWVAAMVMLAGAWWVEMAAPADAAERERVALIGELTPWHAYLVDGAPLVRRDGEVQEVNINYTWPHEVPGDDWVKPSFRVRDWTRYDLRDIADWLGGHGAPVPSHRSAVPRLLHLRTSFGISDPRQVNDLVVTVTGIGGGVVFVNGHEVGRGYMPEGELSIMTPANDYPVAAYTTDDDQSALPRLNIGASTDEWQSRYGQRIRTFTVRVPREKLVEGRNVLAVRMHAAAIAGPMGNSRWAHLGLHRIALSSGDARGVIPWDRAVEGTFAWNARALEQVTNDPSESSMINRRRGRNILRARGMSIRGIHLGNPFDALEPIRMVVPRNGVTSGQVVLTNLAGLKDITAELSPLRGTGGATGTIPADGVSIRYAVQHDDTHYCDALMPHPPAQARTVPVWLIVEVPDNQAPGWYTAALKLSANGKSFEVPVQLLVTPLAVPDSKDMEPLMGMTHSPATIAMHYEVEPWSDEHFRLIEASHRLLGQVGNNVLHIPVLLGDGHPAARDWISGGGARTSWQLPIIRWRKTADGVEPDFTLFDRFLDMYMKYNSPPKALSLYIWDSSVGDEMADAYEGRRIPSRQYDPRRPLIVQQFDPSTGEVSDLTAPLFTQDGAEAFWKPMLDGVHQRVKQRGWDERMIMLSLGGDMRPGQKSGELLRQWAPYARWNIASHFSGDPRPQEDGRLIATGGLEVGAKEYPWVHVGRPVSAEWLESRIVNPTPFLDLPTHRWHHEPTSPPVTFRTMHTFNANLTRQGLDFWLAGDREKPRSRSFFAIVDALTVPGPDGAIPTVRFQMLRESVQDQHIRLMLIRAYLKLPEDQQQPHRDLVEESTAIMATGGQYLGQQELCYDWPGYIFRVQQAILQLQGKTVGPAWDQSP